MYSEFFMIIFILYSSRVTQEQKIEKKMVYKVASIEDLSKFALTFLSIQLEKCLGLLNMILLLESISLNTRSIRCRRHFFQIFTEAIDSIASCLISST